MLSAAIVNAAVAASETVSEDSSHVNPWVIGIGAFLILLLLLVGLVSFGGGRDHS